MRQIAKQLGVTDMTVRRDLAEAEARATFVAPDQITGADGKSYPARRAQHSHSATRSGGRLGGMRTRSRGQGRTPAVGSVKRPSRGRGASKRPNTSPVHACARPRARGHRKSKTVAGR